MRLIAMQASPDASVRLVHLLRELEQTVQYKQPGAGWSVFEKKLRGEGRSCDSAVEMPRRT